jgi:hypothetical protein
MVRGGGGLFWQFRRTVDLRPIAAGCDHGAPSRLHPLASEQITGTSCAAVPSRRRIQLAVRREAPARGGWTLLEHSQVAAEINADEPVLRSATVRSERGDQVGRRREPLPPLCRQARQLEVARVGCTYSIFLQIDRIRYAAEFVHPRGRGGSGSSRVCVRSVPRQPLRQRFVRAPAAPGSQANTRRDQLSFWPPLIGSRN